MSNITMPPQRLIEWQRMLSPENFNKKGGAKFHTAPSIIFPGSPDYPENVSEQSVTIMFRLNADMLLCSPDRRTIENPILVEKQAKKGRKNAPIIIMTATEVIAAVPVSANYYWTCQMLSKHQVLQMIIKPDKQITKQQEQEGKKRGITVIASFMPNPDEP